MSGQCNDSGKRHKTEPDEIIARRVLLTEAQKTYVLHMRDGEEQLDALQTILKGNLTDENVRYLEVRANMLRRTLANIAESWRIVQFHQKLLPPHETPP